MKLSRAITLILSSGLAAGAAQAQLLTNPATLAGVANNQYGLYLGNSTTTYDIDKTDDSGDIGRTFLSGFIARGLNEHIEVYGGLGYGFDVEDGSGTQLGLGLKGGLNFFETENYDLNWYSQLSIYNEDLGESNDISVDNKLSEWLLGVVAVKPVDENLKLYGGLEIVASSLGETVSKKDGLDDFKSDFERSDKIGLRFGLEYKALQVHVGVVDEGSVMVGMTLPIEGFSLPKFGGSGAQPKPVEKAPEPAVEPVVAPEPETREINFDIYENRPVLSEREKLRMTQQRLTDRGYEPGPADGLMGKRTANALRAFQKDQAIPVTGKADAATLEALDIK